MITKEMELFEDECKLLCYKGNMSRSNLGSFYNNEQTNWMYQMWLSSKNREGYKLVPVETLRQTLELMNCVEHEFSGSNLSEDVKHADIIKAMIGAVE